MRCLILLISLALAAPALAQDGPARFAIGDDSYAAGSTVTHDAEGTDDLFMAGETLRVQTDIAGSVHLAGRRIAVDGAVGGALYAAGMEVTVTAPVAGDATAFGYAVTLGDVGGDLRASGSDVTLKGEIGGYALVAGETVEIDGAIAGDLSVAAATLNFGSAASVAGVVTLYEEEPGTLDVPERVADPARIVRRDIEAWEGERPDLTPDFNLGRAIASFLLGVIVVAGLAALIAALVPDALAAMRRRLLAAPGRSVWLGFLALSTLTGASILVGLTLIGLILTPAVILAAALAAFAGYIIGVYALGVGLLLLAGRSEPAELSDRAIAAATGAIAAGIIALVPLLGWLFLLGVTLAGTGALTTRLIAPRFFQHDA